MAKFTFKGKTDKFNPNCTSTLLFDNKDGSTKRIFCDQTTCVDSHYVPTGVITPCRTQMLPADYTDEKFVWGVEGGPWINSVDYSGFGSSPNEFVGGGTFSRVKAPLEPSGCGWIYIGGTTNRWLINQKFFSNSWDIQDTSNAGYGAMSGGDLSGKEIDPATAIGTNIFEPQSTYLAGGTCGVTKTVYEIPEITYYDVGSRLVPEPHIVEFPDALIELTPAKEISGYHETSDFIADQDYYEAYIKPALAGAGKCGMAYDQENHPGPDMPAIINAFTYTNNNSSFGNLGARSYYPPFDNDALPGNTVKRGVRADTIFHTGYRMQKYVQVKHDVVFAKGFSRISAGLRHIETRMYALGYYAVWEFVSVTPKTVYASICPTCAPTDHPGDYRYTRYRFQAKASVKIRVSYVSLNSNFIEYGPFRKDLPTGIQPGQLTKYDPPVNYSENHSYQGDMLTPPWAGWTWERSLNPYTYDSTNNPPPTMVLGSHYLITLGSDFGGRPIWAAQATHLSSALPDSLTDIRNPKKLSTLLYYKNKMNWVTGPNPFSYLVSQYQRANVDPSYISYGGQKFSRLGNTLYPPSIALGKAIKYAGNPGSPDDFNIFRRKVSSTSPTTNSLVPINLSYSAKREWFNGTCPFELDFNFNKSSHTYLKNQCSVRLVPHIEPSGE